MIVSRRLTEQLLKIAEGDPAVAIALLKQGHATVLSSSFSLCATRQPKG